MDELAGEAAVVAAAAAVTKEACGLQTTRLKLLEGLTAGSATAALVDPEPVLDALLPPPTPVVEQAAAAAAAGA